MTQSLREFVVATGRALSRKEITREEAIDQILAQSSLTRTSAAGLLDDPRLFNSGKWVSL